MDEKRLADIEAEIEAVADTNRLFLAPDEDYRMFLSVGDVRALIVEVRRLRGCLNPRQWTTEQSHAWHRAIPDVQSAFEALRDA
jgi:hypothetical protein